MSTPIPAARHRRRDRAAVGIRGGLETAEDAFHLLRQAPSRIAAQYAIGTVPFVLALMYFWADMSRSAYAANHVVAAALGLALAFLWMKSWQSVFAVELRACVAGLPAPDWTWRRIVRLALVQSALQPAGLLAIPVALVIMFPFHAVHAFFQDVTVLGEGKGTRLRDTVATAWRHAQLWPRQNVVLIWLTSPWLFGAGLVVAFGGVWLAMNATPELHAVSGLGWFVVALVVMYTVVMPVAPIGCVVAGNVALLLAVAPMFWHSLTGQQTVFALSGFSAIVNTTFVMTVFGVTYLVIDPLSKAAHVLRNFHGDAVTTGDDLRSALAFLRAGSAARRLVLALVAAGLVAGAAPAGAADLPAVPEAAARETAPARPADPAVAGRLDQAIRDVLARPEYAWRLPRELAGQGEPRSLWGEFFHRLGQRAHACLKWLVDWLQKIDRWLRRCFPHRGADGTGDSGWQSSVQTGLFLALAASASILAVLVLRAWRRRQASPRLATAVPVVTAEALLKDEVAADQLPSDEWLALARDLLARGESRLAVRAMFLGGLAHLARGGRLTVARGKSNRDYRRELERKAHDLPEVLEAFAESVRAVERVWYGMHPADAGVVAAVESNLGRILRLRTPGAGGAA